MKKIPLSELPDEVLRGFMDADQNHDGFLDISEISAALQAKVAVSDSDPNLESKEIARKGEYTQAKECLLHKPKWKE